MAIATPQTIIDDQQRHWRDTTGGTWPDADCVEYLNNAVYALMGLRPHAFSVVGTQLLVAGTKQELEADEYMLLDITRNMGTSGTTAGRIITKVDRWQVDLLNQHWHKRPGKSYTEHYTYEPEKSLTIFYVTPPVSTSAPHYIEKNAATYPAKVTVANQATAMTVAPDESYEPFIKAWMSYEAYLKETTERSAARAMQYLQTAANLLNVKLQNLQRQHEKLKEGA